MNVKILCELHMKIKIIIAGLDLNVKCKIKKFLLPTWKK